MDLDTLNLYKQQLVQVNQALINCPDGAQKEELLTLQASIEELLSLTKEEHQEPSTSNCDDEFATFMAEMEKEGAVERKNPNKSSCSTLEVLKNIEGMKCRAPHKHQWGNVAYHNAMVCSVVSDCTDKEEEIKVRVLFTNPTHQEMLPCPFYYDSDCKFSEEQCRYSHGEIVLYSSLQEYVEPKFDFLSKGSSVLVKQPSNLWYRAIIRKIYEDKCFVRFESNKKDIEVFLEDVLPLDNEDNNARFESSDEEENEEDRQNIINMSLLITPSSEALGDWEKYTKGIGSKLMQKMGYIVGTGLGKNAEGRLDPVTAVILPAGKSLDHCMNLREQAGGDKNLFSVERKLKRMQKKQEKQSQKAYERKSKEENVFNFINKTISNGGKQESDSLGERTEIKRQCSRNLNIMSLHIAGNIKKLEMNLEKINDSLGRHTDVTSKVHQQLKDKLTFRQDELKVYQNQATMIRNEQKLRHTKKKMTIF